MFCGSKFLAVFGLGSKLRLVVFCGGCYFAIMPCGGFYLLVSDNLIVESKQFNSLSELPETEKKRTSESRASSS